MAVKEMLDSGLNCVEYKNGARHTLSDYSDMAIRTANKRAYLYGEGQKRAEWDIPTVVVNSRQGGCSKCAKYIGKVFIDDVYSGGSKADGKYPLLSKAIEGGLFHPRCKDSTSTYYEGITTLKPVTPEEMAEMDRREALEQKQQYAQRQQKRFERRAEHSLDPDNKRIARARAEQWEEKAKEYGKEVEKTAESGIINLKDTEMAVVDVYKIGEIDIDKYKCVTEDIKTNEVIITDERIQHIKNRHPKDFENYCNYMREIVKNPDYIIEANKPNSALILKSFSEDNKKFKTILKLIASSENSDYKNSIITFMKINEKEWNRLIKNKKILYKSE